MWNEVFQFLPMDCRWIMIGDFNMVESPLDRSISACSCLMRLKEELAWVNIKNKYSIEIDFSKGDGFVYSSDNLRDDDIRVLARLDRFYSFASSVPSSHIMHYKILGDSSFF